MSAGAPACTAARISPTTRLPVGYGLPPPGGVVTVVAVVSKMTVWATDPNAHVTDWLLLMVMSCGVKASCGVASTVLPLVVGCELGPVAELLLPPPPLQAAAPAATSVAAH